MNRKAGDREQTERAWVHEALASEERIEPSAGFVASVMAEVHRAAEDPAPIPFPWRRVLIAGLAGLAAAILTALSVTGVLPLPEGVLKTVSGQGSLGVLLPRLAAVLVLTWLATSLPRWLLS